MYLVGPDAVSSGLPVEGNVGAGVSHYPLLLLVGIVLYFTFGEMTGGSVTAILDREQLVRKVAFTGSTRVGQQVLRGCADSVKRCTLELGGKSANVVLSLIHI